MLITSQDSSLTFRVLRRQWSVRCELSFHRVLPNVSIYFRIKSYQKSHIHIHIIIIIIISCGGGSSSSSSSSCSSSSCCCCCCAAAIAAKKYTKRAMFPIK